PADGEVIVDPAVADNHLAFIVEAAAACARWTATGRIAADDRAIQRERANVLDAAASVGSRVAADDQVMHCEVRSGLVEDTAPGVSPAIVHSQTGDSHGSGPDVEDAKVRRPGSRAPMYSQLTRPRTCDGQVGSDQQLTAGQSNEATDGEGQGLAGAGAGNGLAQRAWSSVGGCRDDGRPRPGRVQHCHDDNKRN